MRRILALAASAAILPACGCVTPAVDRDERDERDLRAPEPRKAPNRPRLRAPPLNLDDEEAACDTPAPADTPACGSDVACDADADCADHPGNYCAPAACEYLGCLRGQCRITKIGGEACTRDAECASGKCVCPEEGECTCGPGGGVEW